MGALNDPHAILRERVLKSVLDGEGESEPTVRRAAYQGSGGPSDLQALIDKIQRHAYKVTDEDVARLQAKYGDDKMFEIIVSAAIGAADKRLRTGLAALDKA